MNEHSICRKFLIAIIRCGKKENLQPLCNKMIMRLTMAWRVPTLPHNRFNPDNICCCILSLDSFYLPLPLPPRAISCYANVCFSFLVYSGVGCPCKCSSFTEMKLPAFLWDGCIRKWNGIHCYCRTYFICLSGKQ